MTHVTHSCYAEGVELLITPNEIRGKEARQHHNSNGVELCSLRSLELLSV